MTEKYILVTDEEYCYTLDTKSEDYKTLEDFEKQEFENAKKDNVDIKEYEDAILESASDKYWDWVYENHLEAYTVNDIMNALVDENEQLKGSLNFCTKNVKRLHNDKKELINENEQLKSICQDHRDHAIDFKADCVRLEKENEQLKQHIKRVLENELDESDIPVWSHQYVKSLVEKFGVELK